MKLISFSTSAGPSFGVVNADGVVDAGRRLGIPTLRAALAADALPRVAQLATTKADYALKDVEFLPVIPDPDKILCVGLNYATHVLESGRELPKYPMIFARFAASQAGHNQPLLRPGESHQFDFEGELAVIIGKPGRRIAKSSALAHVAGYSCYNDGSIRDWQRHSNQFTPGKNFERTGGFGPWLVTADEIPDPSTLKLETRLNGEVMQSAPLSDLIFDVPALIEYLSTIITLLPGDVIVTGTTGGVGLFRNPQVWMKQGDVAEIEITGIGVLTNRIVDET